MNYYYFKFTLIVLFFIYGCKTIPTHPQQKPQQVQKDLRTLTGALSHKPLTEEEWGNLQNQIKTNPQAKSAVQTITDTLGNKKLVVKYCPVDGKRFAQTLVNCPDHHVELKILEE